MKKSTLYSALLLTAFVGTAGIAVAQIPAVWTQRYNAPPDNTDEGKAIAVDPAGNAYVTGYAFNGNGNLDAVTIKYNPAGVVQWVKNYDRGINDNDQAASLAVDASGNVYVVGSSRGATSSVDLLVIKYDTQGNELWANNYNGSSNSFDEGRSIKVDGSGNVYVCGYETAAGFTYDMVTIKYNTSGVQQWAQVYNGASSGNDEANELAIDASGNVFVVGYTEVSNAPLNNNYITIKYNTAGVQQWVSSYNGTSNDNDYGRAITLDNSGNVLVTGYSFETNNWFDMLTVKYNSAGVQQWTARYNNAANRYEEASDIVTDINGNVYITGQSQAVGNNSAPVDYATLKYNSAGVQQWVARYDGPGQLDDRALAIAIDDSLNVYATGFSRGVNNVDYATVKYNNAGAQQWAVRYNGTGNLLDQSNSMVVQNGSIYITGTSDNLSNTDFLTIRYSYQVVGFEELSGNQVSMNLYPNPSVDVVNIRFESAQPLNDQLSLVVTDIAGRVVETLATPGSFQGTSGLFSLSISNYPSGVYLVQLVDPSGKTYGQSKLTVN